MRVPQKRRYGLNDRPNCRLVAFVFQPVKQFSDLGPLRIELRATVLISEIRAPDRVDVEREALCPRPVQSARMNFNAQTRPILPKPTLTPMR